ncbi:PD40 domain-containing protein [Sediminitomix flava]|uniref:WD40 repeat protein n=1 Tax=Sediminitomix flava TaxID=379075 RepID=A0A315ZJ42_SEDFL|nr:PD40 domain-containing protein [Sediminitomix flava]PWJ44714.1 WD40 repeat protein [Sediminitomix flava]
MGRSAIILKFFLKLSLFLGLSFYHLTLLAQTDEAQLTQKADSLYIAKQFDTALPLFLEIDTRILNDPFLKFKIADCYRYSPFHSYKALPYLEYASKYKNQETPNTVYYFLAQAYHQEERFLEAINTFNEYLEYEQGLSEEEELQIKKEIAQCEIGLKAVSSSNEDVSVQPMEVPINSSYNEVGALISANEQYLVFSTGRQKDSYNFVFGDDYDFIPSELESVSSDIYISYRKGLNWGHSYLLSEFPDTDVQPLYLSQNGSYMLLNLSNRKTGESGIYETRVKKSRWTKPKKLPSPINSNFYEKGAYLASNGNVIYFSSNRPGGYGGFDIYRSEKDGKGWSEPVLLGKEINTEADEIFPFVSPGNSSIYFSSNGEGSMGGFDVFVSAKDENKAWKPRVNMGYPINSSLDDIAYVESPSRNYAYLSSNRRIKNSTGQYDIISIFRPKKKIQRTLLTGTIVARKAGRLMPLNIKVTDQQNQLIEKYVYNPDTETGRFFMILSPGKNYNLDIFHEGKEIYKLQVSIPEGTYNYELNQDLLIKPLFIENQLIGEKVTAVTSSFKVVKMNEVEKNSAVDTRYDALMLLMEMIVDRTDKDGFTTLNEFDQLMEVEVKPVLPNAVDDYFTPLIEMIDEAFLEGDPEMLMALEGLKGDNGKRVLYNTEEIDLEKGKSYIFEKKITFSDEKQFSKGVENLLLTITTLMKEEKNLRLEIAKEADEELAHQIIDFLSSNGIYNWRCDFLKNGEQMKNGFSELPQQSVVLKLYRPLSN